MIISVNNKLIYAFFSDKFLILDCLTIGVKMYHSRYMNILLYICAATCRSFRAECNPPPCISVPLYRSSLPIRWTERSGYAPCGELITVYKSNCVCVCVSIVYGHQQAMQDLTLCSNNNRIEYIRAERERRRSLEDKKKKKNNFCTFFF